MPIQSPYKVYCKYLMVKAHLFTEDYDILKYNKKIRTSEESFERRRDKSQFVKIANLIDYRDVTHFFISQFVYRDAITLPQMIDNFPLSEKVFKMWKQNIAYMMENYDNDIKYIAKQCDYSWKNAFQQETQYDYPFLFKLVMAQKIHIETYSLLMDLFNAYNDKLTTNDMLYKALNLKFRKYRILLNVELKNLAERTPKDLKIFLDNNKD